MSDYYEMRIGDLEDELDEAKKAVKKLKKLTLKKGMKIEDFYNLKVGQELSFNGAIRVIDMLFKSKQNTLYISFQGQDEDLIWEIICEECRDITKLKEN